MTAFIEEWPRPSVRRDCDFELPRKLIKKAALNMPKLRDRMRQLMKERNLTRRELAGGLGTSRYTLNAWLDRGCTPPAAVGPLLDLIEERPQVRAWLGLSRGKKRKRGRPFKPGNPYRIGSPTRKAALAEARARKVKALPNG